MCETNSLLRRGASRRQRHAHRCTLDARLPAAPRAIGLCRGQASRPASISFGFISSYSPIQDDGAGHNTATATSYYGMLAFAARPLATRHNVTDARQQLRQRTQSRRYCATGNLEGPWQPTAARRRHQQDRQPRRCAYHLRVFRLRHASALLAARPVPRQQRRHHLRGQALSIARGTGRSGKSETIKETLVVPPGSASPHSTECYPGPNAFSSIKRKFVPCRSVHQHDSQRAHCPRHELRTRFTPPAIGPTGVRRCATTSTLSQPGFFPVHDTTPRRTKAGTSRATARLYRRHLRAAC